MLGEIISDFLISRWPEEKLSYPNRSSISSEHFADVMVLMEGLLYVLQCRFSLFLERCKFQLILDILKMNHIIIENTWTITYLLIHEFQFELVFAIYRARYTTSCAKRTSHSGIPINWHPCSVETAKVRAFGSAIPAKLISWESYTETT